MPCTALKNYRNKEQNQAQGYVIIKEMWLSALIIFKLFLFAIYVFNYFFSFLDHQ